MFDTSTDPVVARTLTALAGEHAQLREDQAQAITALLEPGARALVVQATGWGKSAVYWIVTAVLRSRGAGPTLVVSPLLSLMRDQVAAAGRAGLRAATVNSSNAEQWAEIEADLLAGRLDVLLISPERLADPRFATKIFDALAQSIGLIVIDEAHAVSDWGHDFRPDYRRVADALLRLSPQAAVLATTATANARVVDDVASVLGQATFVLRGPLARPSLELAVIAGLTPVQRFAWVVQHLGVLPGSGIVYALTVKDAELLAATVNQLGAGPVAAYHGQLDAERREFLEAELAANRVKALIATSALGMGYDKPDLGFVVHVGSPGSPVAYYQQIGRAGRAIETAQTVLLASESDAKLWDYFATAALPPQASVEAVLACLDQAEPTSVVALEASTGVRRTRVELIVKQLAVAGVVERAGTGWVATGAPYRFDAEHQAAVLARRREEAELMRQFAAGSGCLMELLQRVLDDPSAGPCGRCSVCRGALPKGWTAAPEVGLTGEVRQLLRGQDVVLEPRKLWPSGGRRKGRIQSPPEPGRVLVYADAPQWSELRETLRSGSAVSAELIDPVVAVLRRWDWRDRPTMVLGVDVEGSPWLTDLVEELARVGRLESAGAVRLSPPPRSQASRGEAEHWWQQLDACPALGLVEGSVVLVVVDRITSTWAVNVLAQWLADQGARAVLPLVVWQDMG